MARFLKQNTAVRITVGPFLDKTDGITPLVALTATNEKLTFVVDTGDVPTLVIDANATGSGGNNDLVHITGDDAGYYDLELTAAQTNYVGRAMLSINYATDHLPVFHEFEILPANVYDAMLGTDLLQVDTQQFGNSNGTFSGGRPEVNTSHAAGTAWNSGAIGASTLAADTITAAKIAADAIGASELAADAATEIATAVWAAAVRTLTANTNLNDLSAAGVRSALGMASANLDTQIDALPTAAEIVTALLAGQYEGTETVQTFLRLVRAALLGLVTGAGTTTVTFFGKDEVTDRVVATVDGDGNRSAVVLDGS